MYKSILRPWLFRMDAEKIHGQIVALLHVYRHFPPVKCLLRAFLSSEGNSVSMAEPDFCQSGGTVGRIRQRGELL